MSENVGKIGSVTKKQKSVKKLRKQLKEKMKVKEWQIKTTRRLIGHWIGMHAHHYENTIVNVNMATFTDWQFTSFPGGNKKMDFLKLLTTISRNSELFIEHGDVIVKNILNAVFQLPKLERYKENGEITIERNIESNETKNDVNRGESNTNFLQDPIMVFDDDIQRRIEPYTTALGLHPFTSDGQNSKHYSYY